jgi:hypothetical protein
MLPFLPSKVINDFYFNNLEKSFLIVKIYLYEEKI